MYRDDDEALFQRADALQREVDELREELAKEREGYTATPPPSPTFNFWKLFRREPPPVPFAARKAPAHVRSAPQALLAQINERVDHLGESPRVEDLIERLRALDDEGLERVRHLLDEIEHVPRR